MASPDTTQTALDAALREIEEQAGSGELEASEPDDDGRVSVEGTLDVRELVRAVLAALL